MCTFALFHFVLFSNSKKVTFIGLPEVTEFQKFHQVKINTSKAEKLAQRTHQKKEEEKVFDLPLCPLGRICLYAFQHSTIFDQTVNVH